MRKHYSELRRQQIIRDYFDLVAQTAEFRFRICWEGARGLFTAKGLDPQMMIQLTCDQGDDVFGQFMLPNGSAIACDMKEDKFSRQAVSFSTWESLPCDPSDEDDFGLALEIVSDAQLAQAFDQAVQAFFDFHWKDLDQPLPSS